MAEPTRAHLAELEQTSTLRESWNIHKERGNQSTRAIHGKLTTAEVPTARRVTPALKLVIMPAINRIWHYLILTDFGWVLGHSIVFKGCDEIAAHIANLNRLFARGVLDIDEFQFGVYYFTSMYARFTHSMINEAIAHLIPSAPNTREPDEVKRGQRQQHGDTHVHRSPATRLLRLG